MTKAKGQPGAIPMAPEALDMIERRYSPIGDVHDLCTEIRRLRSEFHEVMSTLNRTAAFPEIEAICIRALARPRSKEAAHEPEASTE